MRPAKLDSGKWQAKYYVYEGGKRLTRSAGTFSTRKDAQDAIDTEMWRMRRGEWVDNVDRRATVGTWAEQWYASRLTPSRKYRSALDAQILPKWKDWQLGDVDLLAVQAWVGQMVAAGLAPSSVRDYYDIFRRIMGDAVEHGRVPKNPCTLKPAHLPREPEGTFVFLTVEETRVLTALAPERYRALIHLAVWSGMRIGELMALRWDSVDLEAGAVTVRLAIKTAAGSGAAKEGPPKNGKTRRVLIDSATVEVLRTHRRDFGGSDYVFTADRGGRVHYENFRKRVWVPLVAAAFPSPDEDAPPLLEPTIHDLRHTHCGLMIAQGMDWIVLSQRMGHHAPSFTMDRYGHRRHDADEVTLTMLEAAAGRLSTDVSTTATQPPRA